MMENQHSGSHGESPYMADGLCFRKSLSAAALKQQDSLPTPVITVKDYAILSQKLLNHLISILYSKQRKIQKDFAEL